MQQAMWAAHEGQTHGLQQEAVHGCSRLQHCSNVSLLAALRQPVRDRQCWHVTGSGVPSLTQHHKIAL